MGACPRSSQPARLLHVAVALVVALLAQACAPPATAADPLSATIQNVFALAETRLRAVLARIGPDAYPTTTDPATGAWNTGSADDWRSGYFPGLLWQLFERTGDPSWKTRAQTWQAGLEPRKTDDSTHDIGFVIFDSFGNGQRLTGDDGYRQVVLTAARTLSTRYSATVGAIRSWDDITERTQYLVIIDNLMNLELLYWAAQHGGDAHWADIARSHALKAAQNHVRPDGSTFQVVNYNQTNGSVIKKYTRQGQSDDSTWARGQAWAVYGFTMSYRYTNDPKLLDTARATADYWVSHLPPDKVPYWDFSAPPGDPRDSSASAIAAAGLLELSTFEADPARRQKYHDAAREQLSALSAGYLTKDMPNEAILLHGTHNKPGNDFDTGLIYGDYYLLEALTRYEHVNCGGRCAAPR